MVTNQDKSTQLVMSKRFSKPLKDSKWKAQKDKDQKSLVLSLVLVKKHGISEKEWNSKEKSKSTCFSVLVTLNPRCKLKSSKCTIHILLNQVW